MDLTDGSCDEKEEMLGAADANIGGAISYASIPNSDGAQIQIISGSLNFY